MNFFKSFLASVLGTVVAFIFIGILLVMSIAGIATVVSSEESLPVEIKDNSLLELDLDRPVFDNVGATQDFEEALGLGDDVLKFYDVVLAIKKAAKDDKIKGIDLKTMYPNMGWSQAQSIRRALEEFKAEGKFIYAYGDYFSQKGYYLASVSDSIFLHPMGGMEFKGVAAEVLYYKDFQEEYGFKMEVVRHGKYKSAVEPYLESEMSEANRTQISSLLNSVWDSATTAIAKSRKLTIAALNDIANELKASLPKQAKENGLVDGLIYEEEYESKLKDVLNIEEDKRLKSVSLKQLIRGNGLSKKGVRDRIAVIYAQGPVFYGEGSENIIGQEVFLKAIDQAVKSRRVKAIVLRVDSPGGSALSSDIIWKALIEAKKEKPLVVSLGNVAASGGYYLAVAGDEIYANDMTITGSIGVFATVPNIKGFIDSVGINVQHVETHKNALGYSVFKSPEGDFRASIKEGIEHVYTTFKQRVANGRGLNLEEVEAIAQGRVWTGKQAFENGLVDGLGGMDQALAAAAKLAQIEEYNLISYPKIEPEFEDFISVMGPFNRIEEELLANYPKEISLFLTSLSGQEDRPKVELRLPYAVEIK
ncbi:MAG: signal peptide peptidase SppA [Flavobacteriaceae bacterium]